MAAPKWAYGILIMALLGLTSCSAHWLPRRPSHNHGNNDEKHEVGGTDGAFTGWGDYMHNGALGGGKEGTGGGAEDVKTAGYYSSKVSGSSAGGSSSGGPGNGGDSDAHPVAGRHYQCTPTNCLGCPGFVLYTDHGRRTTGPNDHRSSHKHHGLHHHPVENHKVEGTTVAMAPEPNYIDY